MGVTTLLLVTVSYVISLFVLQEGFLSKRNVVTTRSTCADITAGPHCWLAPQYRRAVVVVIDALRYDFITSDHAGDHLVMPKTAALLSSKPNTTRLIKFIADAPTTTMQRISAILTGTFPAFIEAGSNFAATEIVEDNLIAQLQQLNRTTVFYGDDTWLSLIPNGFTETVGMDSFNVKDLDSVDAAVKPLLLGAICSRTDYSLLVAHFLGVDHCGHRYGPDHPEMSRKLAEMDQVVAELIAHADEETVVFVVGDHGMTRSGDHGGDSALETAAAMIVHSPKGLSHSTSQSVSQIDLLPTLALLLDVPIPFSNLGLVISDLFNAEDLKQAGALNAMQVVRYFEVFMRSDRVVEHAARKTISYYEQMEVDDGKGYADLIRRLRALARQSVSKYNADQVRTGVISLVESIVLNLSLLANVENTYWIPLLVFQSALIMLRAASYNNSTPALFMLNLSAYASISYRAFLLLAERRWLQFNFCNLFALVTLLLSFLSTFSNSFVVYGGMASRFLSTSLMFVIGIHQFRHIQKSAVSYSTVMLYIALIMISVRLGDLTARCREEQVECVDGPLSKEFSQLTENFAILLRIATSGASLLFILSFSNYDENNVQVRVMSAVMSLMRVPLFVHWLCDLNLTAEAKLLSLRCAQVTAVLLCVMVVCAICVRSRIRDKFALLADLWSLLLCLLGGTSVAVQVLLMRTIIYYTSFMVQNEFVSGCFYSTLTNHFFYSLGHNSVFSAIPFRAAFVFFSGEQLLRSLQGFAVICLLYGGNALVSLKVVEQDNERLILGYIFGLGVQVAGSAFAAVLHRRHLMMYKVFAPHFLFQGVGFVATSVTVILCCLIRHVKNK